MRGVYRKIKIPGVKDNTIGKSWLRVKSQMIRISRLKPHSDLVETGPASPDIFLLNKEIYGLSSFLALLITRGRPR